MAKKKYPKYHYSVIILDITHILSDDDLDDIVKEIGVYSEADDLDVFVIKSDNLTNEQNKVLKEKIKPNQYPYYLITCAENDKLDGIIKEYKKEHWVKNLLGWVDPLTLRDLVEEHMTKFERTVFHADNTDDVIHYLYENLELMD